MQFDNSFDVPLPPEQAWPLLMDFARIAPCMPGAELTEVVDASTYKGRIAVRLGPVALSFAGTVNLESIDAETHTALVRANGADAKGRGGAQASASFRLAPAPAGTTVLVHTDLTLSGAVAQYGRGVGMIQAAAAQLMKQFADNLRAQIAETAPPDPVAPELTQAPAVAAQRPPANPISGFALIIGIIRDAIRRLWGR